MHVKNMSLVIGICDVMIFIEYFVLLLHRLNASDGWIYRNGGVRHAM